jgi:outer membrane protein OmpA-like peptidoglycan-associated protein
MEEIAMRAMLIGFISSCLLVGPGAHAAVRNCAQARADLSLAKERITASADDEATVLLNQSIDECPTYEAYETLAEHLAVSDSGRDNANAVDAFVSAHAHAPTSKDRAQTLFQYAALLNRKGDPQNAYPLIQQAVALDPSRPAIRSLAAEIDQKIKNPKTEEITRALRYSQFKPLKAGSVGRHGAASTTGAQVNVPINFVTNSTAVDEQTLANVATLASALADSALTGKKIVFIGHSDKRGDDSYNETLSRARAEAIGGTVIELEPQLRGMIAFEGRGSREPVNLGTDEASLRANRRLQVMTK